MHFSWCSWLIGYQFWIIFFMIGGWLGLAVGAVDRQWTRTNVLYVLLYVLCRTDAFYHLFSVCNLGLFFQKYVSCFLVYAVRLYLCKFWIKTGRMDGSLLLLQGFRDLEFTICEINLKGLIICWWCCKVSCSVICAIAFLILLACSLTWLMVTVLRTKLLLP